MNIQQETIQDLVQVNLYKFFDKNNKLIVTVTNPDTNSHEWISETFSGSPWYRYH